MRRLIKHKVYAIMLSAIFLLEYASFIPIQVAAISEPLSNITNTQSYTKQYVRDPWFGKKDNNSTLTITLYTNATTTISQDNGARTFVLEYPDVGLANPARVARINSTHLIGGLESGSDYIHFIWTLQGRNNDRYKFSACWNLPSTTDFKLKMGLEAVYSNNIFRLRNGLAIDWSDAVRAGFSVESFVDPNDNSTTYARLNIQSNGCFDPSVEALEHLMLLAFTINSNWIQ